MKILVVGGGGREHALAWKLSQPDYVTRVYVAPGNAGTTAEPKLENIDIDPLDIEGRADSSLCPNRQGQIDERNCDIAGTVARWCSQIGFVEIDETDFLTLHVDCDPVEPRRAVSNPRSV